MRIGDDETHLGSGLPVLPSFGQPCIGKFPLLIDRRDLVRRRVIKSLHQVFHASAPSWLHDVDPHSAAHVPRHAAGIGITSRPLDRDRQPVRLQLATEPDKRLEHVWRGRGIGAGVVPYTSDQLDSVSRHRAVIAIQPSTQPRVLWLVIPDYYDVPVHQKPRITAVTDSIQPAEFDTTTTGGDCRRGSGYVGCGTTGQVTHDLDLGAQRQAVPQPLLSLFDCRPVELGLADVLDGLVAWAARSHRACV